MNLPDWLERKEQIDWTGFGPNNDPVPPLTAETFESRLDQAWELYEFMSKLRQESLEQWGKQEIAESI